VNLDKFDVVLGLVVVNSIAMDLKMVNTQIWVSILIFVVLVGAFLERSARGGGK